MLDRATILAERIARCAVWAGGVMLLFAAALVTVDVLMRRLFGLTFTGADEISAYLFAISTSWAFSFVLLHRSNVRIDALYLVLPRIVRALLDVLALAALGAFMAYFSWRAWIAVETTIDMNAHSTTPLAVPLVVPQSLWFAGMALFMIVWALLMLRSLLALATGDLPTLGRLAGAQSLDEEVQEEIGQHEARGHAPGHPRERA